MPFSYDDATREAYAAAPADTVLLDSLEFLHPAFTQPMRVVNNTESITAPLEIDAPADPGASVLFVALAFKIELPDVDSTSGELQMSIDNISEEIGNALTLASSSQTKVTVVYRGCEVRNGVARLGGRWVLSLTEAKSNVFTATAAATFGDIVNTPFPGLDYTTTEFPGLAE